LLVKGSKIIDLDLMYFPVDMVQDVLIHALLGQELSILHRIKERIYRRLLMSLIDFEKEKHLRSLELDNQHHSDRANSVNRLLDGWKQANEQLVQNQQAEISLQEYKKQINYQSDQSLKLIVDT